MEEVYSCNHEANEDEAADEEDSCFGGVLVEKMWKLHSSNLIRTWTPSQNTLILLNKNLKIYESFMDKVVNIGQ